MQYIGSIVYTIYIDFPPMGDICNLLKSSMYQVVIPVLHRIILRMQDRDKSIDFYLQESYNKCVLEQQD